MAAQTAASKRQDIQKANKMMFLWVAAASVVVGSSLVVASFLWQKADFMEKVLGAKQQTLDTLTQNNKIAGELKDNVRALNVNQALTDAMVDGQQSPVQVVLDALPSVANSSAFGASLQKKILENDNIKIESLVVDPVIGLESQDATATAIASAEGGASGSAIYFTFDVSTVAGQENELKAALNRIEKSIRPITVTSVELLRQPERTTMTVIGNTFFEPAKTVQLTKRSISPKGGS